MFDQCPTPANRHCVTCRYTSPGSSVTCGNPGWFGASGQCRASSASPAKGPQGWPEWPGKLPVFSAHPSSVRSAVWPPFVAPQAEGRPVRDTTVVRLSLTQGLRPITPCKMPGPRIQPAAGRLRHFETTALVAGFHRHSVIFWKVIPRHFRS